MTKEELLDGTDLFLFDLDGTVYLGDVPVPGAPEALARLRADGKRVVFLTNNSSKTHAEYEKKLRGMGLFAQGDAVYTSADATAEYLKARYAGAKVHLLATDAVKEEFRRAGIALTDGVPDVCVLAYDTTLTFEKLRRFNEYLAGGAAFLATHPDDVCPTAGVPMPDVGSFLALFGRSCGRAPDAICGKPFAVMGECVARTFGVPAARTCMVGDRMHTDIRFGNRNGMKTLLVLSGETTRAGMGNFPDTPDLVLGSIAELRLPV